MRALIQGLAAALALVTSLWGTAVFVILIGAIFTPPWYLVILYGLLWYWGGFIIGMLLLGVAKELND